MFSSLLSGLKLSKPDILIATSPPLFVGISGWVLSKYYKIPLVTDIRDLWPESAIVLNELNSTIGKRIGYIMQNTVYNNTSLFLTAVPGFKKYLMKNLYAKNKPMIPLLNGIGEELIQHFLISYLLISHLQAETVLSYYVAVDLLWVPEYPQGSPAERQIL